MPQLTSIDDLLEQMVGMGASDLHVTVGSPPAFRVRGEIARAQGYDALTADDTRSLLYRVLTSEQQKQFELKRQLDFAYSLPGHARFRVNVYYQREAVGAAFRLIPQEIKTLEELGLPPELHLLAEKPRGLVLVTGPTGSGKSTTLAAIIDEINRNRSEHILTVEDPIEFVHRHKRCIVNQREIGPDATSFADALKAALRQDPDVILVGEMRDLETISTALTAAETGHLVFGTLHTQSAPSTIDRIIDVFPPAQQQQVRIMIANSLQAIVTQALLPTADGQGRVAALEILLPDDAVRNLIRQAKIEQVYSIMQTNTSRGMQTMEQALADLTLRRVINVDEALGRTSRPDQLAGLLERSGLDVTGALAALELNTIPAHQPGAALRVAGSSR
ncbi:MAG TPA: type IV pilus twitching motility protein PilT [Gaiellaceae bacterium]|nr:type IV pilus twitching motility protein PilT [Gaiellaceae bacterium]